MFKRKKKSKDEELDAPPPTQEQIRERRKHILTPQELQSLQEINETLDKQRVKQEQTREAMSNIIPGLDFTGDDDNKKSKKSKPKDKNIDI